MQDLGLRISHNRQKQSTEKNRTLLFYCYYFLILAVSNEPQATAVELAQLGEGCRGQAAPCKNRTMNDIAI